jgi:hypothetical protein
MLHHGVGLASLHELTSKLLNNPMLKVHPEILALLAGLVGTGALQAQVLFTSSLDTSTGWSVFQETVPSSVATFGFNYSTLGIPASPNGGGTTAGLRMAVNATATVQAITAATTASFSGQYRVTFDMWGNSAGPFPGGGTGSTEYIGGGVGFSGTAPRAGASLLTTIEGGSATDWRLDKGAAAQVIAVGGPYNAAIASRDGGDPYFSAAFPGQTPPASQGQTGTVTNGAIGFKWYTMQIDVDSAAGTASFGIFNPSTSILTNIGTLSQTGGAVPVVGSGSLTLLDPFTSVSNADLNADLVFAIYDNYRVVQIPEPSGLMLLGAAGWLFHRRRR